nr:MAG TPA: hypothetical protein [Caudoviricetes sp.]
MLLLLNYSFSINMPQMKAKMNIKTSDVISFIYSIRYIILCLYIAIDTN